MNINLLIQFTENDKRLIIAICLIFILVFVFIGYIGLLITKVMEHQGKKLDDMMHDIVVSKVASNKKIFRKIARKKSMLYFVKKSLVPLGLILVASILLLIAEGINNWSYDIFEHTKTGFGTLLWIWDINDPSLYVEWFGITILAKWPELCHTPTFMVEAIWSYFIFPLYLIGIIWYLLNVQCLISRSIRIFKLSTSVYDKSLESFKIDPSIGEQTNPSSATPNDLK